MIDNQCLRCKKEMEYDGEKELRHAEKGLSFSYGYTPLYLFKCLNCGYVEFRTKLKSPSTTDSKES